MHPWHKQCSGDITLDEAELWDTLHATNSPEACMSMLWKVIGEPRCTGIPASGLPSGLSPQQPAASKGVALASPPSASPQPSHACDRVQNQLGICPFSLKYCFILKGRPRSMSVWAAISALSSTACWVRRRSARVSYLSFP